MAFDSLAALPSQQRDAVCSALKAAFGSARADLIVPVKGGMSGALLFRFEIGRRRCLVRVEGPASPLRNPHLYESMRIAADAGIAPRVYHIDTAARVVVTDFVEERPLNTFPGGLPALAGAVGALVADVQATLPFSSFIEYPEMVGRLWRWVCQTGLFAPGVLDPCTEHFDRICTGYVWDTADSVSSHNDPVPGNILFDGSRLWLIDWESAYRNDPLVDVAITLDSFARSPELERVLVRACIRREPDASVLDRLTNVRALTRLYYAGVFLSASAAFSGPLAEPVLSAPDPAAFRRALCDGQVAVGSPEALHALGKIYLACFMTGNVPPGLDVAF